MLKGRTVVVAGASRGIGLACARSLAAEGANTILAARSMEPLEAHAAELRSQGFAAEARRLDVCDGRSIQDFAASLPPVDVLVNVAGTNIRKPFTDYTPEEYERIMRTNLHGIVELTQAIGGSMIKRGAGGKVVIVGSLTSFLGLPYLSVYAMTKSAVAGLTRSLAAEWGRYNIQVNCIAPGFILTDLNRAMWQSEEMLGWLKGVQASDRLGTPEDIAPLAVFLSGPGSDYITGQVIAADGGYSTTACWPFEP